MADEIDVATNLMEGMTDSAVKSIQQNVPRGIGPKLCKECGVTMMDERRKAGYHLCIDCALWLERQESLHKY